MYAVQSPKDMKKNILESRRQSIAVVEGIARSPSLKPGLERKPSLQPPPPSPSLIDLMSSSAMTTGSQSSLRNITVRKVHPYCKNTSQGARSRGAINDIKTKGY